MQIRGQGRFAVPRWAIAVVAVACVVLAACAVWIGTFTHPQADDYVYALMARQHGVLGGQLEYYMTWNGRGFASAMCFFALGAEMPLSVYRAVPALVLAGLFAGFALLTRSLLGRAAPRGQCLLLAGVLTLLYFTGAVSTREGFFWLSGSLNYQPSHILGLLLAALLLRQPLPRGAPWLAALLALCMALANESGMLVLAMALTAFATWALATRSLARWAALAALAACALGMVIDLAAPGLRVRSMIETGVGSGTRPRDPLWAFAGSFGHGATALARLLIHPAFWGVLVLGLPWLVRADGRLRRRLCRWWVPVVPVLWLGFAAGALFPVQFATGIEPPGRIMNVAGWVLVAGALPAAACLLSLVLRLAPARAAAQRLPGRVVVAVGALAVTAGLYLNQNAIRLMRDLPQAPQYDREMRDLRRGLAEAGAAGAAGHRVPKLQIRPRTIAYHEMPDDPDHWHCRVVASYYGVGTVRGPAR
ncbi:MAG: hypothetical protein HS108_08250 [Planctomycetes bacterium]|jgi:hypothetical protein|nr:hypothetical protein [Planctomycetota bacterium]MCL4729646.1 hypothetical protein [Planctomycetota bacterium]